MLCLRVASDYLQPVSPKTREKLSDLSVFWNFWFLVWPKSYVKWRRAFCTSVTLQWALVQYFWAWFLLCMVEVELTSVDIVMDWVNRPCFFFKIPLSQTVMLTIGARLFLTEWYQRVWKYQPSSTDVWSCCLHTEISSLNLLMRSLSHTGEPLPIFYLWDACFIPNPVINLLPVICSTRWCLLAFHNSVPNCRGEW